MSTKTKNEVIEMFRAFAQNAGNDVEREVWFKAASILHSTVFVEPDAKRKTDRDILARHIREIGKIDIEEIVARYDEPNKIARLRAAGRAFSMDHPDDDSLNLLGSFLKRVDFNKNHNFPTTPLRHRMSDEEIAEAINKIIVEHETRDIRTILTHLAHAHRKQFDHKIAVVVVRKILNSETWTGSSVG